MKISPISNVSMNSRNNIQKRQNSKPLLFQSCLKDNFEKNNNIICSYHSKKPLSGKIKQKDDFFYTKKFFKKVPFSGIQFEYKDGELLQKTKYFEGYKTSTTLFSNGNPQATMFYDKTDKKVSKVIANDYSFFLTREKDFKQNPDIQYIKKMPNGLSVKVQAMPFIDVERENLKIKTSGFYCVNFSKEDKKGEISLIEVDENNHYIAPKKGARILSRFLKEMQNVINKDEYKDGFASNYDFNKGLNNAIEYLNNLEN